MKKVFVLFSSLLILAACSHSTASSAKKQEQNNISNNVVEGYIYHDPKTVLFLQFTNANGNLSGSYYDRWEDSNNQLQIYNSPLTGQITGKTITITFKVTGHTFTGNVSNGEIDLAFPLPNGTVSNLTFKPGTLNNFNKYVSEIQKSVANDQQKAQQAQQTANLNNQLSDVEDKINKEMQRIQETDTQALQNDVQDTGKDIDSEKKDLYSLKQDYNGVINEAPGSQTTMDANQVRADANQIQADDNQIQSDNNQFQNDVQQLQGDVASFQNDVQTMNSLASQLGQTLPEYLPKQSDVQGIVSKANSIIKSTTDTMNSYVAASKQTLDSANSLADKAQKHAGN